MNRLVSLCLTGAACWLPTTHAQEHDLAKLAPTLTPVPYANIRNAKVTQNLGPTGARGWVFGHKNHTTESREILIKSIEPGSPADGLLRPLDVISGAAAPPNTPAHTWTTAPTLKPFDSDARLSLARAITWAESTAGGGKLQLLVTRDGNSQPVTIPLPVLGDYSATTPFECPKSTRIVTDATAFLAANMPADGYVPGIGRPLNAAALLASGNDEYLDHVRRSAMRMSIHHTINDAGHETWRWGNTNLFLCEYYLATGDKRVLPTIEEYCKALADGQCNPGTWGHRAVPDFIPPGYGSLNSSGVVCFLSLVLAKQCGITYSDTALRRSIEFYGGYAGRGSIPYGDHPPSYASTSNGKNGPAAIAFDILGADQAGQWFARLCASSDLMNLEGGHTGNFFNVTWSPLGAALAGRDNYTAFWHRFNSYRDLARRRDGSFMTQPYPNTREGDLGTGSYVSKGPLWTTGGFTLSYLADTKRLAILGRSDSVFGSNPPAALAPALALYKQKDFAGSAAAAAKLSNSDDERTARLAAQLADISTRNLNSLKSTLADMAMGLETGDLYKVSRQLDAIGSIIEPDDERLTPFHKALAAEGADQVLADGAKFHNAITGASWVGIRGHEWVGPDAQVSSRNHGWLKELSQKGAEPYRTAATAFLKANPYLPSKPDLSLIPAKRQGKKGGEPQWMLSTREREPKGWVEPRFNTRGWEPVTLPDNSIKAKKEHHLRGTFTVDDPSTIQSLIADYSMATQLRVWINGTQVLDIDAGNTVAKWNVPVVLKPSTIKLLRKGTNTIAVATTPGAAGFDLQLQAVSR